MRISTKARILTATVLATITLIAAALAWANAEVHAANRQRQQVGEIARGLNEVRQVAFEYLMFREERARVQERSVSARLDRLLRENTFTEPEQSEVMDNLRERSATTQRIFKELMSAPERAQAVLPSGESVRRFEAQLTSQLLILQQENLSEAFRLLDFSHARIAAAQRRVVTVVVGGLALIALNAAGAAWLIHRNVLVPLRGLERATHEVASGNWDFKLDVLSRDEIGETSRNFDAMTRSLRDSFAQIERSNQELATLNEEIESFSYSVSHDLRGPLRSMDGFSLALLEDHADRLDAEGQDSLRRIRAACQRMGRLIDDLLRLSQVTRADLAMRPVDLSALARTIASQLDAQQPERQVSWQIDERLDVLADPSLLEIALRNLLENACKFTGKTAHPCIRVGAIRREGDSRLECFVADNGVGFDMAHAEHLFGAFQRLHHEREFPGTGIGLAIVHRIFRRHGVRLWAQAQPGQGATFFFSLKEATHHE